MLRNFPRNFWAFVLWVRKNTRKIPSKFPTKFSKFPCEKSKKIHRRASAGAQGEHLKGSGHVRPRQGTEICNFGVPSPLEALHWIFYFLSSLYVPSSKTSPLKSGESSEKSSGENRVKSCHVCGCHGFFGTFKRGVTERGEYLVSPHGQTGLPCCHTNATSSPCCPKDPAVLKILRRSKCSMRSRLLRRSNLLWQPTCADTIFLGFAGIFSSKRGFAA